MTATQLYIDANTGVTHDTESGKFLVGWSAVDDESATLNGASEASVTELASVTNARIIADAKAAHNEAYGTTWGALFTAYKLKGGIVAV